MNRAELKNYLVLASALDRIYETGESVQIVGQDFTARLGVVRWRWWLHRLGIKQTPLNLIRATYLGDDE